MTNQITLNFVHAGLVSLIPVLLTCVIRRTKALMQARPGPPFFQFVFDVMKCFRKTETVSSTASWLFRANPIIGFAIALALAMVLPWTGAQPIAFGTGAADLILVIYLLALARFFAVLDALDTGSPFGGLGASRESTIAVLVEPGLMLGLVAVSLSSGTMDLSVSLTSPVRFSVALLSGASFILASLAELSRMPVDDTNTHLELTMIHEATILENSGRNLGLIELTVSLRTAVFFGIGVRMLLAGFAPGIEVGPVLIAMSTTAVLAVGVLLGVFEATSVKLNWRRVPSLVVFSTALAVMSAFVAAVGV